MKLEVLSTRARLAAIAAEWSALAASAPMQSPEWLAPWWDVYGGGPRRLAVLAIRDETGDLIGLAPWYVEASRGRRILRWLGDGDVCSDHATILHRAQRRNEVVGTVFEYLTGLADAWTHLFLESTDGDDPAVNALCDKLRDAGVFVTCRPAPGSCSIPLPGTWEEYLAGVSKNHRKRCRRWSRQWLDPGQATVTVHRETGDCALAWKTLATLHNDRRDSLGDAGAFQDAAFSRFHESATPALAGAGRLEMRLLHFAGEVVAAEYVLRDGESLYAYQSGLSAAGEAISAGNLSILALIRDAISAGYRRLDLLRGDEPYKYHWGAEHRPAATIVVRRPTASARVAAWGDYLWNGLRHAKQELALGV